MKHCVKPPFLQTPPLLGRGELEISRDPSKARCERVRSRPLIPGPPTYFLYHHSSTAPQRRHRASATRGRRSAVGSDGARASVCTREALAARSTLPVDAASTAPRPHLSFASTAFAHASDDCGFWPVMRLPETQAFGFQSSAFSYLAPSSLNLVSMRKGTWRQARAAANAHEMT